MSDQDVQRSLAQLSELRELVLEQQRIQFDAARQAHAQSVEELAAMRARGERASIAFGALVAGSLIDPHRRLQLSAYLRDVDEQVEVLKQLQQERARAEDRERTALTDAHQALQTIDRFADQLRSRRTLEHEHQAAQAVEDLWAAQHGTRARA